MIPDLPESASQFREMAESMMLTVSVRELRAFVEKVFVDGFGDGVKAEPDGAGFSGVAAIETYAKIGFCESISHRYLERAIDQWAHKSRHLDVRLTENERPDAGHPVIVSSGIAEWNGNKWQMLLNINDIPITRRFMWWAPFPGNEVMGEKNNEN